MVASTPLNEVVSADPTTHAVAQRIPLPGCAGAHGLRLAPDGTGAFVACEDNDRLLRVSLQDDHTIARPGLASRLLSAVAGANGTPVLRIMVRSGLERDD